MKLNDRRDELRRMSQTQVEAIEAESINEVERSCLEAQIGVTESWERPAD